MRRRIAVALGVLGIVVGGATTATLVFDRLVYDSEPQRAPVIEPAAPPTVRVLASSGAVERSSGAGSWRAVVAGERLTADDVIRTGASSAAELGIGEGSRITIGDGTQITVHEVTSAVHRFRLARGRIAVDYGEDRERRLRVEDDSGRAVEARQGRFRVLATGAMLAVATETGSATLHATGSAVDVGPGEQSAARDGRPPSAPEPIPSTLLLKVASAAEGLRPSDCGAVRGTVSPASSVEVDGRPVAVDDGGRFAVHVRGRRAAVLVTVTDALGRTARRPIRCREVEPNVKDLSLRWRR